jgi:transcription initiation factor IIE alpha subunit
MIQVAQQKRRMRGTILQLLYENHEAQKTRYDDVTLTGVLERLQFDVSVNLVRELLQDLRERGMVSFDQQKNRYTGAITIRKIQISPGGVDIIEKTKTDPAVDVE